MEFPRHNIFGITEEWQTASMITNHPRHLKKLVQDYNNKFGTDEEHTEYILSGSNGYRLTKDKDEILRSINGEISMMNDKWERIRERKSNVFDYFTKNERFRL